MCVAKTCCSLPTSVESAQHRRGDQRSCLTTPACGGGLVRAYAKEHDLSAHSRQPKKKAAELGGSAALGSCVVGVGLVYALISLAAFWDTALDADQQSSARYARRRSCRS